MFEWTREVPEGWQEQLDRICPREDEKVSWLTPVWHAGWPHTPTQRWVIYEMIPATDSLSDFGLKAALDGPDPHQAGTWHWDGEKKIWNSHSIVSKIQWDLWRLGGRKFYPNIFWVIQGKKGGHQFQLPQWQQAFLKESGHVKADTPLIGDLPYAELNHLTIHQLGEMDKLRQWTMALAWDKRAETKDTASYHILGERKIKEEEYAAALMKHLEDQIEEGVSDIPRTLLPEVNASKQVWYDEEAIDRDFIKSTATKV